MRCNEQIQRSLLVYIALRVYRSSHWPLSREFQVVAFKGLDSFFFHYNFTLSHIDSVDVIILFPGNTTKLKLTKEMKKNKSLNREPFKKLSKFQCLIIRDFRTIIIKKTPVYRHMSGV